MLEAGLLALAAELDADAAVPPAVRQAQRRERNAALRRVAKASEQLVRAVEQMRPADAEVLRLLLAPNLGRLLSTAAPGLLIDQPINTTVSEHLLTGRTAQHHGGPYDALEQEMAARRQMVARGRGDHLLAAFASRLATRLQEELDFERLNRGGRPVDYPRRLALFRLLQLYERLAGRPTGSQPSENFRSFAVDSLAALGLDLAGLDPAIDRLFGLLRKARKPPP